MNEFLWNLRASSCCKQKAGLYKSFVSTNLLKMALIKVPDKLQHMLKSKANCQSSFFLNDTLFPVSILAPANPDPMPHTLVSTLQSGFFPKTQIRLCQSSAQSLSRSPTSCEFNPEFLLQSSRLYMFYPLNIFLTLSATFCCFALLQTHPPCCSLSFAHVVFLEISSLRDLMALTLSHFTQC